MYDVGYAAVVDADTDTKSSTNNDDIDRLPTCLYKSDRMLIVVMMLSLLLNRMTSTSLCHIAAAVADCYSNSA